MKLNKNDLKKIIQESVLKMMNEGVLENRMNELVKYLATTAKDTITNWSDVPEELKSKMLANIEKNMQTTTDFYVSNALAVK
jgi:predicted nucleotidyltransferase